MSISPIDLSQKIKKDIQEFNHLKYERVHPKDKRLHDKKVKKLVHKLHKKWGKFGNKYKNLVTYGIADEIRVNSLIEELKSTENKSVANSFLLQGGKTKRIRRRLRKTKKLK